MDLRDRLDGGPVQRPVRQRSWQPNIPLAEYRHNLQRLVELGHLQGAQVWLLTAPDALLMEEFHGHPERFEPDSSTRILIAMNFIPTLDRLIEIHDAYNDAVREVGAQLGVPVVDMAAVYRTHTQAHLFEAGDIVHPNQEGHDLETETLYARLANELGSAGVVARGH